VAKLDRKTDQLMNRIIEADSPALITAYEKQIRKLEESKLILADQTKMCGKSLDSFDDTFRTALAFLANPYELWVSEAYEGK